MRRLQLLTIVTIAIALGAGATIKSYSASTSPAPRQADPVLLTASPTATMPIVVPAEAVDPTARFFVELAARTNSSTKQR
jgi:hypothetical protein